MVGAASSHVLGSLPESLKPPNLIHDAPAQSLPILAECNGSTVDDGGRGEPKQRLNFGSQFKNYI